MLLAAPPFPTQGNGDAVNVWRIVIGGAVLAGIINGTETGWTVVFGVAVGATCTTLLTALVRQ